MDKVKILAFIFFAVSLVYMVYTFVNTLSPPDHIHSRDDAARQPDTKQAMKAVSELESRLNDEPGNIKLWLQLGHIYLEVRSFDKAENIFLKATTVDSNNPEALVDLGIALNANNNTDKAFKIFRKATEKFPEYAEGWLRLGLIYRFRLKDNTRALQYLEKYLSLEPEDKVDPRVKDEIKKIKLELKL